MAEITHKTLFGKIISLKLLPSSFLSFHVFFFYNFLEMCNNYPMLFEGTDLVLFFFFKNTDFIQGRKISIKFDYLSNTWQCAKHYRIQKEK